MVILDDQARDDLRGQVHAAGGGTEPPRLPQCSCCGQRGVSFAGEVLTGRHPACLDVADVGRIETHRSSQGLLAHAAALTPASQFCAER